MGHVLLARAEALLGRRVSGAFLLPALAAQATDASTDASTGHRTDLGRRVLLWWTTAAIGLWFGNGALFVTPGCALVLL